jgi:hypothetical protein
MQTSLRRMRRAQLRLSENLAPLPGTTCAVDAAASFLVRYSTAAVNGCCGQAAYPQRW